LEKVFTEQLGANFYISIFCDCHQVRLKKCFFFPRKPMLRSIFDIKSSIGSKIENFSQIILANVFLKQLHASLK
jgi:hypothetical protein